MTQTTVLQGYMGYGQGQEELHANGGDENRSFTEPSNNGHSAISVEKTNLYTGQ